MWRLGGHIVAVRRHERLGASRIRRREPRQCRRSRRRGDGAEHPREPCDGDCSATVRAGTSDGDHKKYGTQQTGCRQLYKVRFIALVISRPLALFSSFRLISMLRPISVGRADGKPRSRQQDLPLKAICVSTASVLDNARGGRRPPRGSVRNMSHGPAIVPHVHWSPRLPDIARSLTSRSAQPRNSQLTR